MNHASIVRLAYTVGVLFNDIRVANEPEFPEEVMTSILDIRHPYREKVIDDMNYHMRKQSREWQHVRLSTYLHRLGASQIIRVEHRTQGNTLLLRVTLDDNEQMVLEEMTVQRTVPMVPSEDRLFHLSRGRSTFSCKIRRRTNVQDDPLWDSVLQALNGLSDTAWFTTKSLATMQAGISTIHTV